ncbi:MAG TPA: NAD(P)/FAD-dependent oxidoreductase [Bacteroidota bacterium]|nr:NAD(P)/FAD-dependent oxidoreductase [Candidatus Kapabacteria bacterium]HRS02349.1 NAD(P)/FAD-dependent oxidoreductase [Bacteroidota bacterium]
MDYDIIIIGAGVVGLAIATELSNSKQNILMIERHPSFGWETSSRNSEVIHSGIYYPEDSLKTRLCVEGNRLLYEWCGKYNVPHKRLGKYIVAVDDADIENLHHLFEQGRKNGVADLQLISSEELSKVESNIIAREAIFSPNTGIIDSHSLMQSFENYAINHSVDIIYNHTVEQIQKIADGYNLSVKSTDGDIFNISSLIVINSAGLDSDKIAASAGIDIEKNHYQLHYCRGHYFRVAPSKSKLVKHLIYPAPAKNWVGLGIHITPDLAGMLKLGPDTMYLPENKQDYTIPEELKEKFYESVKRFFPQLELQDLTPDQAGIRPKLQGPNDGFRDFIIKNERDLGLPNLINLIGIDSPGLTSCIAIAKYVRSIIE